MAELPFVIWRDFTFSSAHRLPLLPPSHKCSRLHGHNYDLRVFLCGPLEPTLGWVVDFGIVDVRVKQLLEQLDHHPLNEVPGLETCPTTEMLTLWLLERIVLCEPLLSAVEVREKDTSGARLEVEDWRAWKRVKANEAAKARPTDCNHHADCAAEDRNAYGKGFGPIDHCHEAGGCEACP